MAEYDLRLLDSKELVLHFGGRADSVDAFTFSNSLISLGEALQEINRQLNPEFSIEVAIEAVGPGSFRAKVGTSLKSIGGLFKRRTPDLIVNLLASFIFLKMIQPYVDTPPAPPKITVTDDSVIVETGNDRVIVPRATWQAKESLKNTKLIDRHIAKTFSVLESDHSVTEFGLAAHIEDKKPVGLIPRAEFEILAREPADDENERIQDHEAKLVVVRAIFERSGRLWQFVWNGIRISAPITDASFFDKLASREYVFGQGDVLVVVLRVRQAKDDVANTFINRSYEVISVRGVEHAPKQQSLPH